MRLVGYSYGAMIITSVAEQLAERLSHLIYVDAFVPQDGQSALDTLDPAFAASMVERAESLGEGWRLPPYPAEPHLPEAIHDALRRRTDHPLKALQEPLAVRNPVAGAIPRTFILSTAKPDVPLYAGIAAAARRAQAEGWRYRELPTNHRPQWNMPDELTQLLLEVA